MVILYFQVLRNPLTSVFSFRVNELNKQVDKNEDRENRRNLEIEDAMKRRHERVSYHLENQGTEIHKIINLPYCICNTYVMS